ncbi:putative quinol monooxygenase [Rhodococcus qingshengii]|uniref:putative quinol monooxygenase n=1 Tax=Actinomycetes TaxID=1760 RepID=UPI0012480746|nr:putative quinol monooxygenase [Rhodococcus erythropolis]QEX10684.1 antibiotic biosynthesis monooxygenase [Rhodococcus erythropolis]
MIFIVVKFKVHEQHIHNWLDVTKKFTESTRREPGNLWFDWSINTENPDEFILIEAFTDRQAGSNHVNSEHFREGLDSMRPLLSETPKIMHSEIDQRGWSDMGELQVQD